MFQRIPMLSRVLGIVSLITVSACGGQTQGPSALPPGAGLDAVQRSARTAAGAAPGVNFSVLYSFGASSTDGATPSAGFLDVDGLLYGTTAGGGANGEGTVFTLTPSGIETVIHSFPPNNNGGPQAGLIELNGELYGTTRGSGQFEQGTVFKMTTSGKVAVLHSFKASVDGYYPTGLVAVNGLLYGTDRRRSKWRRHGLQHDYQRCRDRAARLRDRH